ncbi:MAG: mechanosensitive ion channel [Planctomycetota bacterium]|nr:mechanosensitive ion channel [Planctomycetota bacterium]MDA1113850.1 mechanosensitive ion channel [Planctomycetota bacterium]
MVPCADEFGIPKFGAAWLPDLGQQARVLADLRERLSAAQIQSIDLEESVNSSMAAGRDAEQVLEFLGLDNVDEEWKSIAQNLLDRRKVLVDALEADLDILVSTLSESLALPVWQAMAVLLPLALCIAAVTGYVFTAEKLAGILAETILFVLILFLVQGFLLRWLKIARLRLAVSQALQARTAKELAKSTDSVEGKADAPALDLEHLDIPSLDAQTRQLFRSAMTLAAVIGLFLLWRSVLPAIGALNQFEVWPQFGQVQEPEVASFAPDPGVKVLEGNPMGDALPSRPLDALLSAEPASAGPASVEAAADVLTLDELLLALVLLFVTLLFARNIPALLELAVLQRLPLDNGTRYAVTTLVRYFVLLVGFGMASGALGVGWEQVQWLAAALTFGLAFGLQEIFANFVSGLIILFERPIRVGDFVTVGDKEGRVLQLRMRATTILDWDRREMLVPNKEFITQRITNWTLSDTVTRIVIPVGIAYGSDTELARRTLMACADEEPLVMKKPPPHAVFRAFGESSLDFQLRVFIENPENWPAAVDHMHQRIDQAFREHNIVIAFPQRDVHLAQAVQGVDVGHGQQATD